MARRSWDWEVIAQQGARSASGERARLGRWFRRPAETNFPAVRIRKTLRILGAAGE
jgi:hypothetical protein